MPGISIKDQLKKLIDLQTIDTDVYDFKGDLEEKPRVIAELKDQFESSKSHLNELEEEAKSLLLVRKEHELELATKEEAVVKAKVVLSEIKTNKEYTAKITEIESLKADMSIIEEKILISMDETESLNKKIEDEKANVSVHEKTFLDKKKEVEDEVVIIKDKIKVLDSKKDQIKPDLDPQYLSLYERVLENKGGLAIVSGAHSMCGGCHINLLPQQINALKMNDKILQCETCQRILYLEDED